MNRSAWHVAVASLWLVACYGTAAAQTAPTRPAAAAPPARTAPGRPTTAPRLPRPVQPAPARPTQKAKPSYSYCRGVARQMRVRGAERRRMITDCQLGILPTVSKR